MRVRLTKFRYGPGVYQNAGTVLDLSDEEARDLVGRGHAELVETTSIAPRENAALRTSRPSGRRATKGK